MPALSLRGVDAAGGLIQDGGGNPSPSVTIDGVPIATVGDSVASHPPCPRPAIHCSAVMVEGSPGITIDGVAVVRAGDAASCGHTATGSGGVTDD